MNIQNMKDTLTELRERQKVTVKAYNCTECDELAGSLVDEMYERSQLISEYVNEIQMMK